MSVSGRGANALPQLCVTIQRASRAVLELMSGGWFMPYALLALAILARLHAIYRVAVVRARRRHSKEPAAFAHFLESPHWHALDDQTAAPLLLPPHAPDTSDGGAAAALIPAPAPQLSRTSAALPADVQVDDDDVGRTKRAGGAAARITPARTYA